MRPDRDDWARAQRLSRCKNVLALANPYLRRGGRRRHSFTRRLHGVPSVRRGLPNMEETGRGGAARAAAARYVPTFVENPIETD